jgi:aminoglycoside phosphotransferase family enzyme/predicted kinase
MFEATMHNTPKKSYPPLLQALCKAAVYPHETGVIRLLETHISWVLLTGRYAYKIKKPVSFAFLDFSTLAQRHFFCQEEMRLNRRLAANVYLEVVPITGTPEHPQFGGAGQVIEYAVKMMQFPEGELFSDRAQCGQLSTGTVDRLAQIIADFHATIARADAGSPYGDSASIRHWFVENFDGIRPLLNNDRQLQQLADIQSWGDDEWRQKAGLMQSRKQRGYVRECHGDLHLNNITLIDGQPVLFDCIEFNPELRWIDVINEVAFLVLDLLHFGCDGDAYRVLNRYLQLTGDYGGLGVLRYYLVYRALVRAKLALLRMQQIKDGGLETDNEYTVYAQLAECFTRRAEPTLIITHGYSGAGKSFLAGRLAEQAGAIQIRSDVERKRLFGYRPQDHSGGGIYSQTAGQQTYRRLAELAKTIIAAGFTVIVDATFLKLAHRTPFRQLASDCGVRFVILDVQASEQALCRRIGERQQDVSEATVEVLQQQLQAAQPLSAEEQPYVIEVDSESATIGTIIAAIKTALY